MDRNSGYFRQVRLLMRLLPLVAEEKCFALKGGTAINLFVRDMPRLSVDIDLVYLPRDGRETALKNIRAALSRIGGAIEAKIPGVRVEKLHEQGDALRLLVGHESVTVKIELSPVLRGAVYPEETREVTKFVEENFGYAEMRVLALPDLYAGKICAALDRQHPRDLFDIKLLLENEGLSDDLRRIFLVYLISHNRPMSELLNPRLKGIKNVYEGEFLKMTRIEVSLAELETARTDLIQGIQKSLTEQEKRFLLSFKARAPDWTLLNVEGVENLPAVRWKMLNLAQMPDAKHRKALEKLENVLKDS